MHGHANIKSLCTYSRVKQSMLAPEWDRYVVPKHRLLTTNLICVISQKSEYLISTGAGLGITQFVSSSRVSEKLWDPSLGPISCCEFLEVLHGNNSAEKRGADNSPVSNSEISITGALRWFYHTPPEHLQEELDFYLNQCHPSLSILTKLSFGFGWTVYIYIYIYIIGSQTSLCSQHIISCCDESPHPYWTLSY